ncbi:hypothetical protein GQ607_012317 [Colletotrichum asianum]|uniref:Uncharacterized protein n=1 Tax=Colletotrichum asianum TaxID=702518 RepID=A0A8H3W741_9PEZI|nr:hypothetical protein GQ607_012317 [Colletotrichum asianum]
MSSCPMLTCFGRFAASSPPCPVSPRCPSSTWPSVPICPSETGNITRELIASPALPRLPRRPDLTRRVPGLFTTSAVHRPLNPTPYPSARPFSSTITHQAITDEAVS